MREKIFKPFRLVGGTSLSLQLGHRMSTDIDLFTDFQYGSIDFQKIGGYLSREFAYCNSTPGDLIGMGKSYFIGKTDQECIKLDLYYSEDFIFPVHLEDGIRMATPEEIIAMKLEIIGNASRKKDFWDIHELSNHYSAEEMYKIYCQRYPYGFTIKQLKEGLINFTKADEDFYPICLLGKHWELIKLDLLEFVKKN